ncbi:MAG: hypothetical protein ACLQA5_18720 [Solirubrobacteraceae bacterium]
MEGESAARDRLEAALAVELVCCPFIGIDYDPAARRLTLTVDQAAHDPALYALADALSPRASLR